MLAAREYLRGIAALIFILPACSSLFAQAAPSITLRMIDNKTGHLISTTDFLVQVDHQPTMHADWVKQNDDGSGKMAVPAGATTILIRAKYDESMSVYINCDSDARDRIILPGEVTDHWYSIQEILTKGVVAPDGCGKSRAVAKQTYAAKPGEFVFFVRKHNWRETD